MNIAEMFFSPDARPEQEELGRELNLALRFANPFETKLPDRLAFTDPPKFKPGGYAAKPGVFGKILRSYLDQKIRLSEFGQLMGKFSATCAKTEWTEFFKPVLEQRLLYPTDPLDSMFLSFSHWWMKITVPKPFSPSYTRKTLPENYYVYPSTERSDIIRIGKGEARLVREMRDVNQELILPPCLESLRDTDQVYAVEVSLKWTTDRIYPILTIKDIFLWDALVIGIPMPYYQRRKLVEVLVNEDTDLLDDVRLGTPKNFDDVTRVFFEQGYGDLVIRDAESKRFETPDSWLFQHHSTGKVSSVHGTDDRGMSHMMVNYRDVELKVVQGTSLLTFNQRKKIYDQREAWVGRKIELVWAKASLGGIPDYAIMRLTGEEHE